jgi:hypothetical protein
MNNSSVQQDYLTISNDGNFSGGIIAKDIISIDTSTMANISAAAGGTGNVTISNTTGTNYYYTGAGLSSSGTISIGAIGSGATVTLNGAGTGYDWSQSFPVDFVNAFPDWDKVQKMCEEYPGLKIAFEKFQTTYKLVVDHYDTPEDKRPKP